MDKNTLKSLLDEAVSKQKDYQQMFEDTDSSEAMAASDAWTTMVVWLNGKVIACG